MRSRQRAFLTILLQNPFSLLMEKKLTNQLSLITRKFPDMESVPWQERRKFMPAIRNLWIQRMWSTQPVKKLVQRFM